MKKGLGQPWEWKSNDLALTCGTIYVKIDDYITTIWDPINRSITLCLVGMPRIIYLSFFFYNYFKNELKTSWKKKQIKTHSEAIKYIPN